MKRNHVISGGEFTDEQMQLQVAIKDHIASNLMIEQDDLKYAPFNKFGGIDRAYELFDDRLAETMEESEEVHVQLAIWNLYCGRMPNGPYFSPEGGIRTAGGVSHRNRNSGNTKARRAIQNGLPTTKLCRPPRL